VDKYHRREEGMLIKDSELDRLGLVPTEVLLEALCDIELELDELQGKKERIRYELLHRHKNKRLKGWRMNG
jgi:hypothetical protein